MDQSTCPIFNTQLLLIKDTENFPKNIPIPYTCEPDSVGISIQEGSLGIYRVYCTNEHGALDWEEIYYDFTQALDFAQKFYVHYIKFLYNSDTSTRRSLTHIIQLNSNYRDLPDFNAKEYQIIGKNKLHGEIIIGGSVRAGLAILVATILADGPCQIENLPNTGDLQLLLEILSQMGAKIQTVGETTIKIDCSAVSPGFISYELTCKLWASCYLVGAIVGRFGEAKVPFRRSSGLYPHPLEPHIRAFSMLGVKVDIREGYIQTQTDDKCGLEDASIVLDAPSEDVTINIMLASVLAHGKTVIQNAAKDPCVVDLANFLNSMGADIMGAGTSIIRIIGVNKLAGGFYSIIPDQIEACTYMAAVAATGGNVVIQNVIPAHLNPISTKLREMGVKVTELSNAIIINSDGKLRRISLVTTPYPGFPVDMQPQIAACMLVANGTSVITDTTIETGFSYMKELVRFGGSMQIDGNRVAIEGKTSLYGCPAYISDPYSGAAVVIAGLVAEGTTIIEGVYHLKRIYSNMVDKLTKVGANIKAINNTDDLKKTAPKTG